MSLDQALRDAFEHWAREPQSQREARKSTPLEIGVTPCGYTVYHYPDGEIKATGPECEHRPYDGPVLSRQEFRDEEARRYMRRASEWAEQIRRGLCER